MATTYNNLYLDIRRQLKAAGIENAQVEARELVCSATEKSREQMLQDMSLYVGNDAERRARELVERRLNGEPVAYIIGEWDFYGMTMEVSRDVLIPRMDTELLAERAILLTREAGGDARMLDLCAGTGCVGLAVAANTDVRSVVLADSSDAALSVCKQNIRRQGLSARVTAVKADALQPPQSNLGDFNVIACNPPYIPTEDIKDLDPSVRDYEPIQALDGGEDGLDFYRAVTSQWGCALRKGGHLAFELGIGQVGKVEMLLLEHGFQDIKTYQDTAGVWRVVEAAVGS
ncbi:MAG: peptide chain release factor N(5)-glutamine methyltransferase [Oscillospiraceae bacterium]|nr:peptide chain release factor N(5)-glutamine methyltransferase [Oscillospiraceae bacterium]